MAHDDTLCICFGFHQSCVNFILWSVSVVIKPTSLQGSPNPRCVVTLVLSGHQTRSVFRGLQTRPGATPWVCLSGHQTRCRFQGSPNPSRCHTVGLRLLPCLQTGDEHLCAELMRHVVFNRALLISGEEAPPAAGSSGPSGTLPPPPPEDPRAELYGVEPARVADRCLQLLAVLFSRHRRLVDALSVTAHFARVCCVFLAGDDLFLDPAVQRGLRQVLQHVLEDPDQLDLTADVPGLASFGDLYTQLLDQFEGVSYGDALFGAVILVPLLPRQPAELRRALWIERPLALRAITTRPEQMLIPLELYLSSVETDAAVLKAYRTALQRGTVTAARNPALHRIATALVGPAA
ncbi:RNA polymerase II-associated protein 1 [Amphibalanus amphitrite]|uniref:RNA polymerase II-associated protein 1 n=1 Tax=Amphibalanus amphitrite TaxID=1232801 RepID=A0A6A4XGF2_AMPAM|nr:RNA polymerase II-associated protein 1 [Amphibalanus amphitrite]